MRALAARSRFALLVGMSALVPAVFPVSPVEAQERLQPALEVSGGWAGFLSDEEPINRAVVAGAARFYLTPRLRVGPEVVYLLGPGSDRDLMLTGNLTVDMLRPTGSLRPPVNPYLIVGGGLFRRRERFLSGTLTSSEGAFTSGGGVRVLVTDDVYIAPEVRVGWELYLRITMTAGVYLGR